MQIVPNAHSYATRANAEKKLRKYFGDRLDGERWFIIAQADGRFTPAVVFNGQNHYHASAGIAVVG